MSTDQPGVEVRSRILVGVDGSEDSLRAVRYAVREAIASDSDLWMVNATDSVAMMTGDVWTVALNPEELHAIGTAVLARARAVAEAEGLPADRVSTDVVMGFPSEALARLSGQAALVVLGRRSLGGLERMFVGSTSVHVAGHAACPVVVVSAKGAREPSDVHGAVAVAISAWPPHTSALQWAARVAARRGDKLTIVHCVPSEGVIPPSAFEAAMGALEAHLQPLREQYPDTQIEALVRPGIPIDELVALSRTVDLLVLGTHPAHLTGLARGVLAHAHCPVGVAG